MIGGVFVTGILLATAADQKVSSEEVNTHLNKQGFTEISPTVPSGTIYQSKTPEISEEDGWSCATISRVNGIPNAISAIKAAGNPNVFENPPYRLISGKTGKKHGEGNKIVSSWNDLNLVYNGDEVCVEKH